MELLTYQELLGMVIQTIVPIAVTGAIGAIGLMWKRLNAFQEGLVALMRDRLVQCCKYYLSLGYMPLDVRTSIELMYNAYHLNHGNGVVTDLFTRAMALPYTAPKQSSEEAAPKTIQYAI